MLPQGIVHVLNVATIAQGVGVNGAHLTLLPDIINNCPRALAGALRTHAADTFAVYFAFIISRKLQYFNGIQGYDGLGINTAIFLPKNLPATMIQGLPLAI